MNQRERTELFDATRVGNDHVADQKTQFPISGIDGSPEHAPANRYEPRDLVASGGMGTIYRAYDYGLRRTVAMKVLHEELVDQPSEMEAFIREARITGQLDHPNVVPVHELDTKTGGTRFSMKLIEGEDLGSRSRRMGPGPLRSEDIEFVVGVLIKVCDAISFAHSRGVLHLDLKPSNVMLGSHGQVYVMDWGIAQQCERNAEGRLNPVGPSTGVRGTLSYMPPEQARGVLTELDERADVYSIGGVLYELLTGRPPFEPRGVPADIVRLGAHNVIDPLEHPNLRCAAPGLAAIAVRALSHDPADRYTTPLELKADLEQFLRGGGWFRTRRYSAGEMIVTEREPGHEAFIIQSGHCDVYKDEADDRRHLRRMGPGEVFGETAILTTGIRTASVRAVTDVTVMVVTREAVQREMHDRGWLGVLVRALAVRFREVDAECTRLRDAAQRVESSETDNPIQPG